MSSKCRCRVDGKEKRWIERDIYSGLAGASFACAGDSYEGRLFNSGGGMKRRRLEDGILTIHALLCRSFRFWEAWS